MPEFHCRHGSEKANFVSGLIKNNILNWSVKKYSIILFLHYKFKNINVDKLILLINYSNTIGTC